MSFILKDVTHGRHSTDKAGFYKRVFSKANTLNFHFWDVERQTFIIMSSKTINIRTINLRCCKLKRGRNQDPCPAAMTLTIGDRLRTVQKNPDQIEGKKKYYLV